MTTTYLSIVVGVGKDMLSVKYLRSNKSFFTARYNGDSWFSRKLENFTTHNFWGYFRIQKISRLIYMSYFCPSVKRTISDGNLRRVILIFHHSAPQCAARPVQRRSLMFLVLRFLPLVCRRPLPPVPFSIYLTFESFQRQDR